jgi:hypothetical protein
MPAAALGIAEAFPPGFGAIAFLARIAAMFSVDGLAEYLIMPLETRDIIGRLNQESEQIQKRRGVFGLWIERIEIRVASRRSSPVGSRSRARCSITPRTHIPHLEDPAAV